MKKSIGFIGGGRITKIFLQAFQNKGYTPTKTVVHEVNESTATDLQKQFPHIEIANLESVVNQDVIFIALHPPVIMETIDKIKDLVKPESCLISLAPKITIGKISSTLNGHKNIARLIPNATSYINKGYNPLSFSKEFRDKEEIIRLLSLLGNTFLVEENKLEAYAIISAMLPTYFWFQWQEMYEIGIKLGLDNEESKEAVEKTLAASIETMYHSELSYEKVIDLIPVKPIAAHERHIQEILSNTLSELFEKIKP